MAIKPGLNTPPTQPQGIPQSSAQLVTYLVSLTHGQSTICYIMNEVIFQPISIILASGTDIQVEVSVSNQNTIWDVGAEDGGLWSTLNNSNHDTYLDIQSPVTAVRFTNTSGSVDYDPAAELVY